MRPNEIRTVFEFNYWAFEKVWDCVMKLNDAQFTEELDYSRGSTRNLVVHMMSATRRWIIRLNGGEMVPHFALEDFSTLAATKDKWDELRAEALDYVNALSEADLDGIVRWQLPDRGMDTENTRWEILLHVAITPPTTAPRSWRCSTSTLASRPWNRICCSIC